jgi:hypothetical protein
MFLFKNVNINLSIDIFKKFWGIPNFA